MTNQIKKDVGGINADLKHNKSMKSSRQKSERFACFRELSLVLHLDFSLNERD